MGQRTSGDQLQLVQQDENIEQKRWAVAAIIYTNGTGGVDGDAATDASAKYTDASHGANKGAGLST